MRFLLPTTLYFSACGVLFAGLMTGCGPSSNGGNGGNGGTGGSTTMSTGEGGSGGSGGAGGAVDPYTEAVKAASWTKLVTGPSVSGGAKQDDIFFLDADHGFVASGYKSSVFETKDGGATWTSIFSNSGTYFRSVLFTDAQHGFAGNLGAGLTPSIDDPNVIYSTSDGGVTWAPVTTIDGPAPAGICNFTALDSTHLFAVGRANGPSHLLASSDGGATWKSTDLSPWFSMVVDAHFTSPTEGLVVGMSKTGAKCNVERTTDGGATFTNVFKSTTVNSLCWKIDFPSEKVGYVAVQDTSTGPGTFAKTTDGGLTWQELPLPPTSLPKSMYPALSVGFVTDEIGWVGGQDANEPVYRTYDGGMTWEEDPTLKNPINTIRFVDEKTAYAVGADTWKLSIDWNGN